SGTRGPPRATACCSRASRSRRTRPAGSPSRFRRPPASTPLPPLLLPAATLPQTGQPPSRWRDPGADQPWRPLAHGTPHRAMAARLRRPRILGIVAGRSRKESIMLTMTENAATAVKGILAQNPGNDDAGLRIFGADDPGAGFALTVATAEETD